LRGQGTLRGQNKFMNGRKEKMKKESKKTKTKQKTGNNSNG